MTNEQREATADWLMLIGALILFGSLFLTWSHQFSPTFLAHFGTSDLLRGVPRDPTAWQVYTSADVLLAALSVALVAVALFGSRWVRVAALAGAAIALGFTLHAISAPPSSGANIFNPSLNVPNYVPNSPAAGAGETVALVGLIVAGSGLLVSFTAD